MNLCRRCLVNYTSGELCASCKRKTTCIGCGQDWRGRWKPEELVQLLPEHIEKLDFRGQFEPLPYMCPTCVEDCDLRF